MVYLVIGTRDSGKSALAEELAAGTGDRIRIYLATMKVLDDAGKERVERHRAQRAGKGFVTVEREYGIADTALQIKNPGEATVLLECVSNLVGNELYDNPKGEGTELLKDGEASPSDDAKAAFADRIAGEIRTLTESVNNTVVVTNDYKSDDDDFDKETRLYIELLDMVNDRISAFADKTFDLRKEDRL